MIRAPIVAIGFGFLGALGPSSPLAAQAVVDSAALAHQVRCDESAQILAGGGGQGSESALRYISACPQAPSVLPGLWVAPTDGPGDLARLIRASGAVRDQRVFDAALARAQDATASARVRVAALAALGRYVNPSLSINMDAIRPLGPRPPGSTITWNVGWGIGSHPLTQHDGPMPLSIGFESVVNSLIATMSDPSEDPLVRTAAVEVDGIILIQGTIPTMPPPPQFDQIVVTCLRATTPGSERSTITVDITGLLPGEYGAVAQSGNNRFSVGRRPDQGGTLRFDFDSDSSAAAGGAELIDPDFILFGAEPDAIGSVTDNNSVVFASAGVDCQMADPIVPAALLVIDGDGIAKGEDPNDFSDQDVNADLADLGVRTQLRFFENNVGQTITLYSGEVGDEGWFAVPTIPGSWGTTGPTSDGLRNFVGNPSSTFPHNVGPGLGVGNDPEALLDEIPNVTPLRATGLKALEGLQVCAVVFDSDISINYGPLDASLKGATLGTVAFEVLQVTKLTGGSSSALPKVEINILDADMLCEGPLEFFTGAPVPTSSSTPFDTDPGS